MAGSMGSLVSRLNLGQNIAIFSERQSSGTHGGSFSSGARRTRELNTEEYNGGSFASLNSNQITITESGTYLVYGVAVALGVFTNRLNFASVSGTSFDVLGPINRFDHINDDNSCEASLVGVFTVDVESDGNAVCELQHECNVTKLTDGFGDAAALGEDEKYSEALIIKVSN